MKKKGPVLVVDDDEDIREAARELLLMEGHAVLEASNGRQALMQLEHVERPCVMLLDLMMPEMNGHQVLEVLRQDPERVAGVAVIVWTAGGKRQTEPFGPPVRAVLHKPFDAQQFLDLVEKHCA